MRRGVLLTLKSLENFDFLPTCFPKKERLFVAVQCAMALLTAYVRLLVLRQLHLVSR